MSGQKVKNLQVPDKTPMLNNRIRSAIALLALFQFTALIPVMVVAQNQPNQIKLVVGVVVDQMQFDQLHKYRDRYGEDGLNLLLNDGFEFQNTNYNYIPTVTAAGHASIYTGTTPSTHGIIDNLWYDRELKSLKENVSDPSSLLIGSEESGKPGRSPAQLQAPTLGDAMKAANPASKVISVSFKDRGAILPGGKQADAAYWQDWKTSPGYFVSSSYYMSDLPEWVRRFNRRGYADRYLDRVWETLYPLNTYDLSAPDDNDWERILGGKDAPVFPYRFPDMRSIYKERGSEYQLLWISPYGNTLLTDFALEAISAEKLGKDEHTDLLAISYSVTDVAGHTFGPQSVEIEDIFLRLDQEIARLIDHLNMEIGSDNYLLFLTSDHGVNHVPGYLRSIGKPTGVVNLNQLRATVERALSKKYGSRRWVEHFSDFQMYLDNQLIEEVGLNPDEIRVEVAQILRNHPDVVHAYTSNELSGDLPLGEMGQKLRNGFNPDRSGDVLLVFPEGFAIGEGGIRRVRQVRGAAHGSGYAYDSHVPLIFFGGSVPAGRSVDPTSPVDIFPTMLDLLDLEKTDTVSGRSLKDHISGN